MHLEGRNCLVEEADRGGERIGAEAQEMKARLCLAVPGPEQNRRAAWMACAARLLSAPSASGAAFVAFVLAFLRGTSAGKI